jgi:hypothetical protein
MSERSELSEALAELIERSEKKEREGASEVGRAIARSRSKPERINLKMGAAQSEGGEDKKIFVEGKGRGKWEHRWNLYSCFFARARHY